MNRAAPPRLRAAAQPPQRGRMLQCATVFRDQMFRCSDQHELRRPSDPDTQLQGIPNYHQEELLVADQVVTSTVTWTAPACRAGIRVGLPLRAWLCTSPTPHPPTHTSRRPHTGTLSMTRRQPPPPPSPPSHLSTIPDDVSLSTAATAIRVMDVRNKVHFPR